MTVCRHGSVAIALVAGLAAQVAPPAVQLEILRDANRPTAERVRALGALQEQGAFEVPLALAILGDADERLAGAAAAILRHEWLEFPAALERGLLTQRMAAVRLLRELAMAPRPAARLLVSQFLRRDDLSPGERCLALAARGEPLRGAEVGEIVAALLEDEVAAETYAATALLQPASADAMAGRLHAMLDQRQLPVGRILPLLERMSPRGHAALLAASRSLPAEAAEELCQFLLQTAPEAVHQQAAAMLDGNEPLLACFLLQAEKVLQQPQRRERLLAVLQEETAAAELAERAFTALVAARCVDPRVLAFAARDPGRRLERHARLLDDAAQALPEAVLLEWLAADPELVELTLAALLRRDLTPRLERAVLDLLIEVQIPVGPAMTQAVAVILQRGQAKSIDRLQGLLLAKPELARHVDLFWRRNEPFVVDLLKLWLARAVAAAATGEDVQPWLLELQLALCARGHREGLSALVDGAAAFTPAFARRCAELAVAPEEAAALQLLRLAGEAKDELAGELVAWAATCRSPVVEQQLRALWSVPEIGEREDAALWAWAAGPGRESLAEHLRVALHNPPLQERDEWLAYAWIGNLPEPLDAPALRLLAELALKGGLGDLAAEAQRAARWPDGRGGFTLVAAVAERLRGAMPRPAAGAFAAVARQLLQDGLAPQLVRQRVLVLWHRLGVDLAMLEAVGGATAPLLLAIGDPTGFGDGAGHALVAKAMFQRGEHANAAAHARAAIAGLLRDPAQLAQARLCLGDRAPSRGEDGWAALAALPWLCAAQLALAAGDADGFAKARAAAYEFGGADLATRTLIQSLPLELPR